MATKKCYGQAFFARSTQKLVKIHNKYVSSFDPSNDQGNEKKVWQGDKRWAKMLNSLNKQCKTLH